MGRIFTIDEGDFPVRAALSEDSAAIAIIAGVEGPSYRPAGAMMVIGRDGTRHGTLSSGCIDADVAARAVDAGHSIKLRYGMGSPFFDIALPCGGGLDILVLPQPDRDALDGIAVALARRETAQFHLPCGTIIQIQPRIRFLVFGKGPEAVHLAVLAKHAGHPVELFSPDDETLQQAGFGSAMTANRWPEGLAADGRTAVAVFFHDHEREPPLLDPALRSPAFYVGAQGSLRAHKAREGALRSLGVPDASIARLASPFGLIPSARDAGTLAVSVLADVLRAGMVERAASDALGSAQRMGDDQ